MITCPKCNATLPDWTQTCQFCQTDVKKVPRPKPVPQQGRPLTMATAPQWVWGAYYGLSALFIAEGAADIFEVIQMSQRKVFGQVTGLDAFSYISVAFACFTILVGIGLMLRIELIRRIVNFFCGVRIILGILGLVGSFGSIMLFGALGAFFFFMSILDIASAAFMSYLIGETDKYAPNL